MSYRYLAKVEELSRAAFIQINGKPEAREAYKTVEPIKEATRFASRHAADCAARTYINLQAPAVRRYMSYTVEELHIAKESDA